MVALTGLFLQCINYLSFYGLLSALKALKATFKDNLRDNTTIYEDPVIRFLRCKKPSKLAYEKLVACKQGSPTKSQGKWLTDCGLVTAFSVDWRAVYKLAFRCTRITSLIVFQFKLLHRRIATNYFLFKIGLHENDHCNFCHTETESLIHLFWFCRKTNTFFRFLGII